MSTLESESCKVLPGKCDACKILQEVRKAILQR